MGREQFADRLGALCAARGPICAGLDPRADQLPTGLDGAAWAEDAARLLAPRVAALKPQLAFFEDDWRAPERVAAAARGPDEGGPDGSGPDSLRALVIADAKRGDIGSTAEAYARRILGPASSFDALTVNPYLGADSLAPFIEVAAEHGRGLFVLVKTSNPGAADLQDLQLAGAEGQLPERVCERVARLVDRLGRDALGRDGRSLVGAVVGLTADPALVRRLRELMPQAFFLMPGYGAQGGSPEAYQAALDARGGGVLVSASRSLTLPWKGAGPADWRQRVLAALGEMRADLGAA